MSNVTVTKRDDYREGLTFPVVDFHQPTNIYTIDDGGEYFQYHYIDIIDEGETLDTKYLDFPEEEEEDVVNHPSHYGDGSIECIDYMEDNMDPAMFMGYLEGNVKKYTHRYRYKNGVEDLKKAGWYLDYLIAVMERDK